MSEIDVFPEHLVAQIVAARKLARLSQDELASLAYLSRRPIYELEHGSGGVKIGNLLKILDALGLEMTFTPKAPKH